MKSFTPIICLIIAGALFYWYVNPSYADMKSLQAVTDQYNTALTRARQVGMKRDDLAKKYNNFKDEDVAKLVKVLPDKVDNIRVVIDLDNIAKKYGTTIRDIKLGEEKTGGDNKLYSSMTTTFGITLTYDKFLLFLEDIQKNMQLTDIATIDFKSTDSGLYSFTVAVQNYWLK